MKFLVTSFTCLFSLTLVAQWNPNTSMNTPIAIQSGKQNDARIMEDNSGGAFIAWKDARISNLNPDIYIQRVDAAGFSLWALNGVVLCDDTSDQSTPNIVSDMRGGAIVSWSDRRNNGERDVYAQRISGNGIVQWTSNGVPVATKPMREHNEKIISDDAGGAIIVWEQFDTINFLWDVWAQRIDSNGIRVWQQGGIPVVIASSNKINPKLQKDKKGGAIITWQDFRNGMDYDIYAQRMSATGTRMWGTSGVAVTSVSGPQINPKIDPDSSSGGVYIAWQDVRNGMDYDIYCQRIDSNGTAIWSASGISVCNSVFNQSAVDILSNSQTNGLILTWKDSRSGNEDIYAQRISTTGTPLWQLNGKLIATSPYAQINPNICSDGMDGAIITWQDSTVNDWDVYAQKINSAGQTQWQANGVVVSDAIEIQSHPKNIPDGNGGSIFVWQDKRSGFYDIYCHHIYFDGTNVGMNETSETKNLSAYPNPFQNEFQITFHLNSNEEVETTLFSADGRKVNTSGTGRHFLESGEQTIQIFTNNLPAGVYFLRVKNSTADRVVKLLKQ